VLFGLFCWAINVYQEATNAGPPAEAAAAQRINRIDLPFQLSSALILLIGMACFAVVRL